MAMITEFPTRVPTVRKKASTATTSVSTTTEDKNLKSQVSNILKETMNSLKAFTNKMENFFNTKLSSKSKSESATKEDSVAKDSTVIQVGKIVDESLNVLKSISSAIIDYFQAKNGLVATTKIEEENKDEETTEEKRSFKRFVRGALNKVNSSWKNSLSSLSSTMEGVSESVGGAVSKVFGGGMFGKMMGNIIKKAIGFAVNKLLVGIILSNLPMTLIVLGIVAAIALIVYYSKEIWEAIKWLGYSIDQGIDWIVSKLPWGKSKYEQSRQEMADALGVSAEAIKDYYGDTVKGRNQAYEDWKAMKDDPAALQALADKVQAKSGWVMQQSKTQDSLQLTSGSRDAIKEVQNFITNNTYNNGPVDQSPLDTTYLPDASMLMTPVTNTTVNNVNMLSSINPSNVSTGYGMSPVNNRWNNEVHL